MTELTLQLVVDSRAPDKNKANNGAKFLFPVIAPVDNGKSQNTVNFDLFDKNASETSNFRFGGQREQFKFSFVLFNDGTDRSGGTGASTSFGSTVITLAQQIQYLRDIVFDSAADSSWTLTDNTGRFYSSTANMFIEELRFNNAPGSASMVTGEMTLTRGVVLSITSIFT